MFDLRWFFYIIINEKLQNKIYENGLYLIIKKRKYKIKKHIV